MCGGVQRSAYMVTVERGLIWLGPQEQRSTVDRALPPGPPGPPLFTLKRVVALHSQSYRMLEPLEHCCNSFLLPATLYAVML